jgi:catechol 2,3-dioxygenase-like lactoylglutathione lyase family enzyme
MENPSLTFNFIGVSVVDWHAAFKFFSKTLGLRHKLEPALADWAVLGVTSDADQHEKNRSASFELFDRGRAVAERCWGLNQGIRPGFHVSNLQNVMMKLDIPFTVEERSWGKAAEFSTVEGIRFALAEIPNASYSDDLSTPYIGHVAIKCADFEAMQHFYVDVLGFTRAEAGADYALLTQPDGFPFIVLERGGNRSSFDVRNTPWENNAVRAFPVFISLMTTNLRSAYDHLTANQVTVQREWMTHEDWGGSDFHIADPDGNAIQVVQYR